MNTNLSNHPYDELLEQHYAQTSRAQFVAQIMRTKAFVTRNASGSYNMKVVSPEETICMINADAEKIATEFMNQPYLTLANCEGITSEIKNKITNLHEDLRW